MTICSPGTRRAAAGGAFVAALVAACGSQAPATSARPTVTVTVTATPSARSRPASGPPARPAPAAQCPASALRVTVTTARGGAAAGTSYLPLDFTNISGHGCDMYGFPGVSFVTGHPGSQIGDPASRSAAFGAQAVTLARGGTAHAWLGVADAGNFPSSSCHPVTAHWLKIYPPDQYTALYTRLTAQVCSKTITTGSTPLMILPVRPGPGAPGRVP